jgi:hypothetical protein
VKPASITFKGLSSPIGEAEGVAALADGLDALPTRPWTMIAKLALAYAIVSTAEAEMLLRRITRRF